MMKSAVTRLVCIFFLTQACADGEVKMSSKGVANQMERAGQGLPAMGDDALPRSLEESSQDAHPVIFPDAVVVVDRMDDVQSDETTLDRMVEDPSPDSNGNAVEDSDSVEELALLCLSPSKVLTSGEETRLSWQAPSDNLVLLFAFTDADMQGTLTQDSDSSVIYQAPNSIDKSMPVSVIAQVMGRDETAKCTVQLQADQDLGVANDGLVEGLVGYVYEIPTTTTKLPDFSAMQHQSEIVVRQLNIPNRAFDAGFPGAEDLIEWFGIQFKGRIMAPVSGWYDFQLSSDDGANLYINGDKVVDNDGVHAVRARAGRVYLEEGLHDLRVDYFQGPRYHIALQLFWKLPDMGSFAIIASEHFARPATP